MPEADLDDAVQEVFIVLNRRFAGIEGARERAFRRGVAIHHGYRFH